jgi:radical SAM/Cys-rich protein
MSNGIVSFESMLDRHGFGALHRAATTTLQINVGKVCNQACQHCHVDAGPKRSESMPAHVAERVLALLSESPSIQTVDITGGAPELNANFRRLVEESRGQGRGVIDRCNLTILLEPGFEDLAEFLAAHEVEISASLPCYTRENVDRQRGRGVFDKSIEALRLLNRTGYGVDPELSLNLVFNPTGASLPPAQEGLEADYKEDFVIVFNHLFTITNRPISRFGSFLTRIGQQDSYVQLLRDSFNPGTVEQLMCRALVSVGWDGRLYDCDFNQMLDLGAPGGRTIWEIDSFEALSWRPIATGEHCFGCTAGACSSCGGKLT